MSIESTKNWVIVKSAVGAFIGQLDETKSTPDTIVLDPTYELVVQKQAMPDGQGGVQLAPVFRAVVPIDLGTSDPLTEHPRASSVVCRLANLSEKDRQMYVKMVDVARQAIIKARSGISLISSAGMPIS